MEISIIIPTKNRPEDINRTVLSAMNQTRKPLEIIIVDDSDDSLFDANERLLNANDFKFNNIFHVRGKGESANSARNQGASLASGDILLFLDDDVELDSGYLSAICTEYEQSDDIGAAGGVISNFSRDSGFELAFKKAFFLSRVEDNAGFLLPSGFPCHLSSCETVTEVEILSGSNFSMRQSIFDNFKWDEDMKGYSYLDDVDISYRISRFHRVIITPKARLFHYPVSKTNNPKVLWSKIYYHYLFYKKIKDKTFKNNLQFAVSLIGNLAQSIGATILLSDIAPFRCTIKGIKSIMNDYYS